MKYANQVIDILILFTLFGCGSSGGSYGTYKLDRRVQKMEVQSHDCSNAQGFLQFENDTIRIAYVFWSNGGTMGLYVHNKLGRPIYIDWRKTSFIAGSSKHDYWDETVTVKESGSSGGSSAALMGIFLNKSSYSSITKLTKPERITFLPPGVTIEKSLFRIADSLVTLQKSIIKDTLLVLKQHQWLSGKDYYDEPTVVPLLIQEFTQESSPITFRSFITYSLDERFSSEAYVNTSFYVSTVIQMPLKAFDAKTITDPKDVATQNIWMAPNVFYAVLDTSYKASN